MINNEFVKKIDNLKNSINLIKAERAILLKKKREFSLNRKKTRSKYYNIRNKTALKIDDELHNMTWLKMNPETLNIIEKIDALKIEISKLNLLENMEEISGGILDKFLNKVYIVKNKILKVIYKDASKRYIFDLIDILIKDSIKEPLVNSDISENFDLILFLGNKISSFDSEIELLENKIKGYNIEIVGLLKQKINLRKEII